MPNKATNLTVTFTTFDPSEIRYFEAVYVGTKDGKSARLEIIHEEPRKDSGIEFWPFWLEGERVWKTLADVAREATAESRRRALRQALIA